MLLALLRRLRLISPLIFSPQLLRFFPSISFFAIRLPSSSRPLSAYAALFLSPSSRAFSSLSRY